MTRAVSMTMTLAAVVAGLVVAILSYGWALSLLTVGIAVAVIGGCAGVLSPWVVTRG